ncbi:hypothetical protein K7W42_11215 [Deinococcus sp. HMF7604]|uniref:hypothetical protein n=1 Tax=Deinococcus betulae TaxID=2873312 RepID=UPI001CCC6C69|nr:hypothetical protein [Deinococcus betulae]MBZ9751433.1 hypothetical protein [Deinococcus betulae]
MTVPPDPQTNAQRGETQAAEGQPEALGRAASVAAAPAGRPFPSSPALGRPAPQAEAPAPSVLAAPLPQGPTRSATHALIHLLGGVLVLGLLAYFMWTPGEWTTRLLAWVLLTILADEFGGWYGYAGLVLGGLGYFSPVAPPEQWSVVLPLVGGALGGLLLLKHSGGLLVLPFAGALFAGVLVAAGRFATKIDPELTLPGREDFQRTALLALLLGLGISAVRQIVGLVLRAQARRRERLAAQPV